jgi:hypothetical protein
VWSFPFSSQTFAITGARPRTSGKRHYVFPSHPVDCAVSRWPVWRSALPTTQGGRDLSTSNRRHDTMPCASRQRQRSRSQPTTIVLSPANRASQALSWPRPALQKTRPRGVRVVAPFAPRCRTRKNARAESQGQIPTTRKTSTMLWFPPCHPQGRIHRRPKGESQEKNAIVSLRRSWSMEDPGTTKYPSPQPP